MNAFYPGLREEAIETLTRIAGQCDGVRCDMAMLMLNRIVGRTWESRAGSVPLTDYWEELIPSVKRSNDDFILIAETYWDLEWELMQQGFDYCYDKRLYDRLEKCDPEPVRLHLSAGPEYQFKLARFIENHDEPRAAAVFAPEREYVMAVTIATLPGVKIFYEGQFDGRKVKLPVFLRRRPAEIPDEELHGFYRKLLGNTNRKVFHDGQWQLFESYGWQDNSTHKNLLAWGWSLEDELFLIVVNLSSTISQGRIKITWPMVSGHDWRLTDPLSGQSYDRNGDEMSNQGLYISLEAWGYHFFRFTSF